MFLGARSPLVQPVDNIEGAARRPRDGAPQGTVDPPRRFPMDASLGSNPRP